ncbi:hypothetical protein N7457_002301 [Penicillium paradoxum]|uniref:uncharacterized protein n=1 Tax=Penicillium paradoxum TaxID=176176 RepID=UPI00254851CB|nr:uncharacterized protein N7457_002301 [Penicillium paradoxum]KAJ5787311.1 hypothetical protein N7457_002301 [Penicillium paradoxum]
MAKSRKHELETGTKKSEKAKVLPSKKPRNETTDPAPAADLSSQKGVHMVEKRARPWVDEQPRAYHPALKAQWKDELFIIDHEIAETKDGLKITFDVVGSTGNVYKVVIGKVPTCECPSYRYRGPCKHIGFVLHEAMGAPAELVYQKAFLQSELTKMLSESPLKRIVDETAVSLPGCNALLHEHNEYGPPYLTRAEIRAECRPGKYGIVNVAAQFGILACNARRQPVSVDPSKATLYSVDLIHVKRKMPKLQGIEIKPDEHKTDGKLPSDTEAEGRPM